MQATVVRPVAGCLRIDVEMLFSGKVSGSRIEKSIDIVRVFSNGRKSSASENFRRKRARTAA
jgi:hypothetical protein